MSLFKSLLDLPTLFPQPKEIVWNVKLIGSTLDLSIRSLLLSITAWSFKPSFNDYYTNTLAEVVYKG